MVARAWLDPDYKARMLKDGKKAAIELGIEVTEAELMVIDNTEQTHNLIVCTLCPCYPRSLLGEPPAWYVSKNYRSRAVREPREVLKEFGLALPDSVEVRVHDSNADLRYIVMPLRPKGTEDLNEGQLADLVSRPWWARHYPASLRNRSSRDVETRRVMTARPSILRRFFQPHTLFVVPRDTRDTIGFIVLRPRSTTQYYAGRYGPVSGWLKWSNNGCRPLVYLIWRH